MKIYTTAAEAVMDMHERGYTNDFQLFGNDLLWVQEKTFIRTGLFAILEYHRLWNPAAEDNGLVLLGVISAHHSVRGILFINFLSYPGGFPSVIVKKINELNQKLFYRANIENDNL